MTGLDTPTSSSALRRRVSGITSAKNVPSPGSSVTVRQTPETLIELLLAVYFLVGVGLALYFVELAVIPFQLMFLVGFGMSAFLSIRGYFTARG